MRKSTVYICFTALNLALFALAFLHAFYCQTASKAVITESARMVHELRLTDLCLFTEARYTRNPSVTDVHAPFQDHPGALEHFPSGSFVPPPAVRTRPDEQPG